MVGRFIGCWSHGRSRRQTNATLVTGEPFWEWAEVLDSRGAARFLWPSLLVSLNLVSVKIVVAIALQAPSDAALCDGLLDDKENRACKAPSTCRCVPAAHETLTCATVLMHHRLLRVHSSYALPPAFDASFAEAETFLKQGNSLP